MRRIARPSGRSSTGWAIPSRRRGKPTRSWSGRRSKRGPTTGSTSPAASTPRSWGGIGSSRSSATRSIARRHQNEPQLVTLVGEPGIGKSRLVHELFVHIEDMPDLITWRQGRCLPYGDGVSYWALGEMVKAEAGILETDPDGEAAAKLDRSATELIAEEDERRWVARHLRPLIGLAQERDSGSEAMDDGPSAWRRFLESLAERRPTVLVFEDLHWADDGLLDFLDDLIDWTRDVPLLVLCTARPELLVRRPDWGGGKLNAATLALAPLSDEETAVLLAGLLDRSVLPAELQSALLARAGGNPLYAEEFARMAADRPVADLAAAELPGSVQGIIAARLDGLPPGREVPAPGRRRGRQDVLARCHRRDRRAGSRRPRATAARAGARTVRPSVAPLIGRRGDRIRVPASPRPRCGIRADPSGRPRREASCRGRLDRIPRRRSPRGPSGAARPPLRVRARAHPRRRARRRSAGSARPGSRCGPRAIARTPSGRTPRPSAPTEPRRSSGPGTTRNARTCCSGTAGRSRSPARRDRRS